MTNSIIDSYEMRVKTVNDLMEQAYHFLGGFHAELQKMIVQLKENLGESRELGIRKYIEKPIEMVTLARLVQEVLDGQ